jgi:hypothetical protein
MPTRNIRWVVSQVNRQRGSDLQNPANKALEQYAAKRGEVHRGR